MTPELLQLIAAVVGLGVLWGLLGIRRDIRRERKLAVETRRAQCRQAAAQGHRTMPVWTITHPRHPIFADPREQAAFDEWQQRRNLGEF